MFRFRKQPEEKSNEPEWKAANDPLTSAEEAHFRASVLEARARSVPSAPAPLSEPEIVWDDCDDVYRPGAVNGREWVASLRLDQPIEWKRDQPYIFMRRGAFDGVQAHLRSDRSIEQGGLLAGQVFRDAAMGSFFVLVEEAFPALNGHGTSTHFEYTSASWQAITPRIEGMNAAWTVVGSYHSHPDAGVFLSQTDKNTQADVFSHDWQIALVIDPVRDEIGFFIGERGTPCLAWRIIA